MLLFIKMETSNLTLPDFLKYYILKLMNIKNKIKLGIYFTKLNHLMLRKTH